MEVSVVVAFREDSRGKRARLWRYVRDRIARAHPEFEIVESSDDGRDPFCKAMAMNRAVARSSGEILAVWDTDTWVPPKQVNQLVRGIREGGAWGRPYAMKVKLGERVTEWVLTKPNWSEQVPRVGRDIYEGRNAYWAAPPFLIRRDVYERAGGIDEGFRGWGGEDEAFGRVLRTLVGRGIHVKGNCYHLWHPRIGRSGHDLWEGQKVRNGELTERYARAAFKPEQLRVLLDKRRREGFLPFPEVFKDEDDVEEEALA